MKSYREQLQQLREKWPQSHIVPELESNGTLLQRHVVFVPSVMLPAHFVEEICTVLFVLPMGFPFVSPDGFYTDIPLHLKDKGVPQCTQPREDPSTLESLGLPQWAHCQRWYWHPTQWSWRDTLTTYVNVIRRRFEQPQ